MQLDIGFGDVVHPGTEERDFPTFLDLPPPRLRMYPRETVVSEKFEAMVHLGTLNSRLKDFFDLWQLSRTFDFAGRDLALAIDKTFAHRGTPLDPDPVALTIGFTGAEGTQRQWAAFVARSRLDEVPSRFEELCAPLRDFLLPVVRALAQKSAFDARWSAGRAWTTEASSQP